MSAHIGPKLGYVYYKLLIHKFQYMCQIPGVDVKSRQMYFRCISNRVRSVDLALKLILNPWINVISGLIFQ